MALELRQVEIRTAARARAAPSRCGRSRARSRRCRREIGRAVDQDVLLGQVPAARAHEQRRGLLAAARSALPSGGREVDAAANRVAQVDVALDVVVPLRRVRVLEVGHEDAGARVERVDDHLAVDRAGDLDAAIGDVGGQRRRRSSRPRVSHASRAGNREACRRRARPAAARGAQGASCGDRRKSRCRSAANATASGVRISAYSGVMRPVISIPGP